ncbi:hypothetical protein VTO73DRAFT_2652 [Trametes versicolor]
MFANQALHPFALPTPAFAAKDAHPHLYLHQQRTVEVIQLIEVPAPPPRSHISSFASSSFASSSYDSSESSSEEDESVCSSYCSSEEDADADADVDMNQAPVYDDTYKTRYNRVLAWREGFAKVFDDDEESMPVPPPSPVSSSPSSSRKRKASSDVEFDSDDDASSQSSKRSRSISPLERPACSTGGSSQQTTRAARPSCTTPSPDSAARTPLPALASTAARLPHRTNSPASLSRPVDRNFSDVLITYIPTRTHTSLAHSAHFFIPRIFRRPAPHPSRSIHRHRSQGAPSIQPVPLQVFCRMPAYVCVVDFPPNLLHYVRIVSRLNSYVHYVIIVCPPHHPVYLVMPSEEAFSLFTSWCSNSLLRTEMNSDARRNLPPESAARLGDAVVCTRRRNNSPPRFSERVLSVDASARPGRLQCLARPILLHPPRVTKRDATSGERPAIRPYDPRESPPYTTYAPWACALGRAQTRSHSLCVCAYRGPPPSSPHTRAVGVGPELSPPTRWRRARPPGAFSPAFGPPYEHSASRFRERNTGRLAGVTPVGVHTLARRPRKRRAARMRIAMQPGRLAYLRRAHAYSTGLAFADLQVRTVLDPMCFPAYVGSTVVLAPLQMRPCYCAGHPPVCPALVLGGLLRQHRALSCTVHLPRFLLDPEPVLPARAESSHRPAAQALADASTHRAQARFQSTGVRTRSATVPMPTPPQCAREPPARRGLPEGGRNARPRFRRDNDEEPTGGPWLPQAGARVVWGVLPSAEAQRASSGPPEGGEDAGRVPVEGRATNRPSLGPWEPERDRAHSASHGAGSFLRWTGEVPTTSTANF